MFKVQGLGFRVWGLGLVVHRDVRQGSLYDTNTDQFVVIWGPCKPQERVMFETNRKGNVRRYTIHGFGRM